MEKIQLKTTYFIFGSLVSCKNKTFDFVSLLWPWRMSHNIYKEYFLFFQCWISLSLRLQGESAKHLSYSEMFNLICLVKRNEFQRTEAVLLLFQCSKHNDLCELLICKRMAKVNTGLNWSTGKNHKLIFVSFLSTSLKYIWAHSFLTQTLNDWDNFIDMTSLSAITPYQTAFRFKRNPCYMLTIGYMFFRLSLQ